LTTRAARRRCRIAAPRPDLLRIRARPATAPGLAALLSPASRPPARSSGWFIGGVHPLTRTGRPAAAGQASAVRLRSHMQAGPSRRREDPGGGRPALDATALDGVHRGLALGAQQFSHWILQYCWRGWAGSRSCGFTGGAAAVSGAVRPARRGAAAALSSASGRAGTRWCRWSAGARGRPAAARW